MNSAPRVYCFIVGVLFWIMYAIMQESKNNFSLFYLNEKDTNELYYKLTSVFNSYVS